MSNTASRSVARVPPLLLDLLRSESQLHARKRLQDPGTQVCFFPNPRPAARPSLKTPTRRLLDVTVARWTCASGKERGSPQVKSAMSNAWARQIGASSAWFYSLAWIFLSSPERFLRGSDRDPARQTETCEYEPCVNLALRSWNKVEVSDQHRVYGVRVLCLFLLLFVFLFPFFFFHFYIFRNGQGQNPPSPKRACPYFGKCGNLRTVPKVSSDPLLYILSEEGVYVETLEIALLSSFSSPVRVLNKIYPKENQWRSTSLAPEKPWKTVSVSSMLMTSSTEAVFTARPMWPLHAFHSKVGKVKVSYLTSVAKQSKTAFLHGPTVWKSPIVGIEPATFRSESAALTTAPQDPTQCSGDGVLCITSRLAYIEWGRRELSSNTSFVFVWPWLCSFPSFAATVFSHLSAGWWSFLCLAKVFFAGTLTLPREWRYRKKKKKKKRDTVNLRPAGWKYQRSWTSPCVLLPPAVRCSFCWKLLLLSR